MEKVFLSLILAALALPVHAAEVTIEERDDVYIIEYQGDSSAKATEPEENPASAASDEQAGDSAPVDVSSGEPDPMEIPTAETATEVPMAQPRSTEPDQE